MSPVEFVLTVAATTAVVLAAQSAHRAVRANRARARTARLLGRDPSRVEREATAVGYQRESDQ